MHLLSTFLVVHWLGILSCMRYRPCFCCLFKENMCVELGEKVVLIPCNINFYRDILFATALYTLLATWENRQTMNVQFVAFKLTFFV
ncbi:MAG: hypothetical protein J3R72DRAFT_456290 [Linnemannia gamsii]|nr:MAG: hypothetical protein J3R72DRAFT_456290 [Linnemannia gamsii]